MRADVVRKLNRRGVCTWAKLSKLTIFKSIFLTKANNMQEKWCVTWRREPVGNQQLCAQEATPAVLTDQPHRTAKTFQWKESWSKNSEQEEDAACEARCCYSLECRVKDTRVSFCCSEHNRAQTHLGVHLNKEPKKTTKQWWMQYRISLTKGRY